MNWRHIINYYFLVGDAFKSDQCFSEPICNEWMNMIFIFLRLTHTLLGHKCYNRPNIFVPKIWKYLMFIEIASEMFPFQRTFWPLLQSWMRCLSFAFLVVQQGHYPWPLVQRYHVLCCNDIKFRCTNVPILNLDNV